MFSLFTKNRRPERTSVFLIPAKSANSDTLKMSPCARSVVSVRLIFYAVECAIILADYVRFCLR